MFGMGTGVTSSPWSPGNFTALKALRKLHMIEYLRSYQAYGRGYIFQALDHLVSLTLTYYYAHSCDLSNR